MILAMRLACFSLLSISLFIAMATAQTAAELVKLQHAVDLYRVGDFATAAAELEAMRATGAKLRQSEVYLGAAYVHLGKELEARAAFRRAWAMSGKFSLAGEKNFKVTKKEPDFWKLGYPPGHYLLRTAVEFLGDGTTGFVFEIESSARDMFGKAKSAARKSKFNPESSIGGKSVTVVRFMEYEYDVMP